MRNRGFRERGEHPDRERRMGDDDDELESVPECFKTAYLAACERQDRESLMGLLELLVYAIERKETSLRITIRGNTPQHFGNRVEDADLLALVGALQASPGIMVNELDLSWNSIGDESVQQFSEYQKTNEQIAVVNLAYNEISEAGATALAESLSVNRSVWPLVLSLTLSLTLTLDLDTDPDPDPHSVLDPDLDL